MEVLEIFYLHVFNAQTRKGQYLNKKNILYLNLLVTFYQLTMFEAASYQLLSKVFNTHIC